MLPALLEERFKLAVHTETRCGAEYSLVAAKGGPKIKQVDDNAPRASGWGPTMLRGTMNTSVIASQLTTILDRPVLDHSGLSGIYKVDLQWLATISRTVLVIDHVERPSGN